VRSDSVVWKLPSVVHLGLNIVQQRTDTDGNCLDRIQTPVFNRFTQPSELPGGHAECADLAEHETKYTYIWFYHEGVYIFKVSTYKCPIYVLPTKIAYAAPLSNPLP
jgi:hypothetical protein